MSTPPPPVAAPPVVAAPPAASQTAEDPVDVLSQALWNALRGANCEWSLRDLGAAVGNLQVQATLYMAARSPEGTSRLEALLHQLRSAAVGVG